jgi:serine/threonine protein kinase
MPNPLPIDESDPPHALPRGTLLNDKFRLERVIGVGGFGIVYLAHDEMSDVDVAIKEYMPLSLAGRTRTMQVSLTSQSNAETFALGLKSFWNEARLLARFRDEQLPLLKVHDAFQANGTAYMVMPVLRGRTAYQVRREMPKPPNERWLRTLLTDLLPALERLHAENVFHRDIAPDNIQIDIHAKPVLMDLGAARHVISNRTQSITAILKPGYAPIEQYGENDSLRQGPWTDIYALGATLHFLLLNSAPPSATSRMFDAGRPLAGQDLPGCSPAFLRVIDWMLALRPEDRPQDVAQLRKALDASNPMPRVLAPKPAPRIAKTCPDATAVLATGPAPNAPQHDPSSSATKSALALQRQPPRRMMLAGATALIALVIAGGSATWLWPRQAAPHAAAARAKPNATTTDGTATALRPPPTELPSPPTAMEPPPTPMATTTEPAAPPDTATAAKTATSSTTAPPTSTPPSRANEPSAPVASTSAKRASPSPLAPPAVKKAPLNDKDGALLPQAADPAKVDEAPPPPPAPPPPMPAAAPAPPTVASPSERCSDKDGFARTLCVSLVCGAPALHDHPQCMAIRRR